MKLKGLLLTAAVAASANVMATDYYVKPGNAATGNDGSSWDKALTIWDIYQNEAVAKKKAEKLAAEEAAAKEALEAEAAAQEGAEAETAPAE